MSAWAEFKKNFDTWEDSTARTLERVLKSPTFIGPSGATLSAFMRARAAGDAKRNELWAEAGIATRLEQERTLHLLSRLESRMLDLESRMDVLLEKLDAHDAHSSHRGPASR